MPSIVARVMSAPGTSRWRAPGTARSRRRTAGASVVVEPVAVSGAELDHRVLWAGAEAAVAFEAVAARQATPRLVGRLLGRQAADHLREICHALPPVRSSGCWRRAASPKYHRCRRVERRRRVLGRARLAAPRSQASMWRAAFLPCPTPTVTVRSAGHHVPAGEHPGTAGHQSSPRPARVPSRSNSTPGTRPQERRRRSPDPAP